MKRLGGDLEAVCRGVGARQQAAVAPGSASNFLPRQPGKARRPYRAAPSAPARRFAGAKTWRCTSRLAAET